MKICQRFWDLKDGIKFYDYPDFQPKITHPKHFSCHCIYKFFPVFFFKSNNFGLRDRQLHLQGLERYFAVCHLKKMNSKTAFIILGSIVPLSIVMHLPVAWWFEWHINDNGTVIMVSNSEFILASKFYIFSFYEVVKFVMPMVTLTITSILIIKKVPKIKFISNNLLICPVLYTVGF